MPFLVRASLPALRERARKEMKEGKLPSLLTYKNPKTRKGEKKGYLTGILHLAPDNTSGLPFSLCPRSSVGCRDSCLAFSGMARKYSSITVARIKRALLLGENKALFLSLLREDIQALERKAIKKGLVPAVRLNGTSDILWERESPSLFYDFPRLQFYDYTKIPERESFANYHLTFSLSEDNRKEALAYLAKGNNVAAVFFPVLPSSFLQYKVLDGDISDLRFLDSSPRIVGLLAKGKEAKSDTKGFIQRVTI